MSCLRSKQKPVIGGGTEKYQREGKVEERLVQIVEEGGGVERGITTKLVQEGSALHIPKAQRKKKKHRN